MSVDFMKLQKGVEEDQTAHSYTSAKVRFSYHYHGGELLQNFSFMSRLCSYIKK